MKLTNVLDLFDGENVVNICAPMVRYSKLPFRTLVRKYNCDLCFTPMIVADSFIKSPKARNSEFTTNIDDDPLIVQFAANNASDFVAASEIVAPFCNGVDLNCGCPQKWAIKEGFGVYLLRNPELIKDIVIQLRNRIPEPFTMSVKLRILEDNRKTVDLCQNLEHCGVSFVTVHARTPEQKHEPIDSEVLHLIQKSIRIPLIANGDVKCLKDVKRLHKETGCQGVMAARGILSNPTLFTGLSNTSVKCVEDWIYISMKMGISFQCFHHHLVFMLEKILPKHKRIVFNCLKNIDDVLLYLKNNLSISLPDFDNFNCNENVIDSDAHQTNGQYFIERTKYNVEEDSEMFLEDSCLSFYYTL